jgi:NAD(P)-dependent dehydrogenase (short-subunit alcohol dehydrogenase family)
MKKLTTVVVLLFAGTTGIPVAGEARTVFVTGANSGIGLEFVKQYAAAGWDVIATHRRDSVPDTLRDVRAEFSNVRIERMDVTSREEIYALADKLRDVPIDVLINNAGVYQLGGSYDNQLFGQLNYDYFDVFVNTNIRGPIMIAEAFIEHVKASSQRRIVSISSSHGMVTQPPIVRGAFWYGMSKAALNKMMMTLSYVLEDDGVIVILFHPGSVLTERQADLTFPGMIETTFSVEHMIDTIAGLDMEDSGHFLLYDGSPQAW